MEDGIVGRTPHSYATPSSSVLPTTFIQTNQRDRGLGSRNWWRIMSMEHPGAPRGHHFVKGPDRGGDGEERD